MKTKLHLWLFCAILFFATPIFAQPITVTLNGEPIAMSVAPILENGVTLVPLRVMSESLGAHVDYNPETKAIEVSQNGTSINLTIDQLQVQVNGKLIQLELAPRLVGNTTMVPLRLISENLNCTVEWLQDTQTIVMTKKIELPTITITIKGYGEIIAELYPEVAPNTVNNFISLTQSGFYDGLIFHRVISDFMIQGGCPLGTGSGGPGYSIAGEFALAGFNNTLKHTEGVLSMARSMNPHSAGSQFFIMTSNSPHLDGQYAAFGKVISGMEHVYAIEAVQTNVMDAPLEPIVIESITVDTKGVSYDAPIKM